jgi:hypothetical protein
MNLDHQIAVADMITEEHLRPDRVGDGKDRITVDALSTAQLDSTQELAGSSRLIRMVTKVTWVSSCFLLARL